jgi:hypothetical protein
MRPVGAKKSRVRLGSSGQYSPRRAPTAPAVRTLTMASRGIVDSPTAERNRTLVGVTSSTRPTSDDPSRSVSTTC